MLDVAFAVPGDLDTPTGGYAYARELLQRLPTHDVAVRHIALPGGFPHPSEADLGETLRRLRGAAPAVFLLDGLAYGALPDRLLSALSAKIVALVHHPLAFESGLAPRHRAELMGSETAALALATKVIASSAFTARLLCAEFGVCGDKIAIAEPGTEPARRATGSGRPVSLLAVGAVSPRKAYDDLVHALSGLQELPWRLTIVGALDRSPEAVKSLRRAIDETGLGKRVELAGTVQDAALDAHYDSADAFVSPSLFEGYGMVLAEAMARGLPLIASTGGAAAETMPDEAGIKVPPGEPSSLREGLRRMIEDSNLRERFADGSWNAGQRLPRWTDTVAKVAAALREAS